MADYFDMAPTPFDNLMDTVNGIASQFPTVANSAIFVDSITTTGRAGMNFCTANNFVARACFAASCACGTALATSFLGIPAASLIGSFGARGCNRLGKCALAAGNFTNGNFTNVTEISELMN